MVKPSQSGTASPLEIFAALMSLAGTFGLFVLLWGITP